jgi:NAD(P)H-dependent FMN reductase
VFQDKPVVLLSTSPGARGGASVLATATAAMPFFGGQVIANLAIPSFYENFDTGRGELKNAELNAQLHKTVNQLNALTAA